MPHYQINNIIVDTEPETDDSDDSEDLEALIQNLYESDVEGKELLIPDFINEDTKENDDLCGISWGRIKELFESLPETE